MKRFWLWFFAILVMFGIALYWNRNDIMLFWEQWQWKEKNEARALAAEKERAELLEQKSKIEDISGKEELARIKGYEKSNEKPLMISPKSGNSKSKKNK
ncbi:MAG TPA: hypothetical protein VNK96_03105 [Fimbriimonadales bacterium]|nr:hypothetical protein [Fimbriimonadales bacterium]